MKRNKINFTKRVIENLKPTSKRNFYYDTQSKGLILTVYPSGIKSFYLYRKINGYPDRILIGQFPQMDIEDARRQAVVFNSQIIRNINPKEAKKKIKNDTTFCKLFEQYIERHAKPHKKSWQSDIDQFKRYLKPYRGYLVSTITKQDIQKLHLTTGEKHGLYAANRLLALISSVFVKAIDWGLDIPNPAKGIKKFKENSRSRFLQADELPRFFTALAEEANETIKDYILISLLTGARKSNILSMRWEQINFIAKTWTIPVTKNGEEHTIPLAPQAIEILEARKNNSEWVFPTNSVAGHLTDPKRAWARILEKAQIKNLRIHDLRRSLGSWQAATGASLSVIGKTLAHKNVSTTAIYARLNIDPVRDALEKATDAMFSYR